MNMIRGWAGAAAVALVMGGGLTGCAVNEIEPDGIKVHPGYSASGAAWRYRQAEGAEPILVGASASFQDDVAVLRDIWGGLPGRGATVSVEKDSVSEVLLITLDRSALATDNPFRGGLHSWWYDEIYFRLIETVEMTAKGGDLPYRHSIHLAARTVDRSLLYDAPARAQVRLRSLATWLMEDGLDPRMITAQVMESEKGPKGAWELAIALRPYQYGKELAAETFLPPWLY
ncbi:hypothetical protein VRRI112168_03565 [Vreelandella rituensis]|uniref:Uncharacterized protein n=1 Tax=Vreelandella rituensis TaxID=2282306 RepID=A0A368U9W7_9GAMM|nr:hypothetical protein [Halomonas rituensis]RCV93731.1 hypothetical protein DU506_00835 [Halomonas rituensis]